MRHIYLMLLIALLSCQQSTTSYRSKVDLSGEWQFALDTASTGADQQWFLSDLPDVVQLPGTTDLNHKGFLNTDTTTMHLNRVYKYEGAAWYRKKVIVPESFADKHVTLFLERTKTTKVWIDSTAVGGSQLLQSPQQFDVSDYLTPGKHTITVQVNNDLSLTPYGNVHIYSDDTQTNWNGIIGKIYLEASDKTYISNLQVYPDIDGKKIAVKLDVVGADPQQQLKIDLFAAKTVNGKTIRLKKKEEIVTAQAKIELEYPLGNECELWDDYQQPLYQLTAIVRTENTADSKTVPFGMRKFEAKGTQFQINGRTVFLRGKHEAAVFPLTGFTPMNVDDWRRVYRIAKSYGINHYRFHTYCPPEAAFTAADQEGIYLQAELPFWGGLDSDTIADMLRTEGMAMLKAYANHPSFVLFSPGNEIWGGHERVDKNILAFKAYDNRPLYTMGSNVNIGYMEPKDYCDFFVGARVPEHGDSILGHTRLTHAFPDARDGGILNTQNPTTDVNFEFAVSHMPIPLISHEIGQYQIFPDYREIDKYTGVLRARNLEVFRDRLAKAGMADLDSAFHMASGAWSALCYKAEMEAAIRTKGMAGFQLLDLQDFPGQGTALVGILDAFMDSKGVITPEAWKQSCSDVVLLAEFPKFCWTNAETFQTKIIVANYSDKTINTPLSWKVTTADRAVVDEGVFDASELANGGLDPVGELSFNLGSLNKASELTLHISLEGTAYTNSYPIWVYPAKAELEVPEDILVAEKLSKSLVDKLNAGAKVLLFPHTEDVKEHSVAGHFPPEFWNYGMFKGISEWVKKPVSPGTLGLLVDPEHPLFTDFPTEFHTNWQWFSIVKASNSLILDELPDDYLPIVQVIDNLERNHKLGMIFELKVGAGKLLVCMSQLNRLKDKPEALQLYQSILNYMESNDFDPKYEVDGAELQQLL